MKSAREMAETFVEKHWAWGVTRNHAMACAEIERMLNEHAAGVLDGVENEITQVAKRYPEDEGCAIFVAGGVAVDAVREKLDIRT